MPQEQKIELSPEQEIKELERRLEEKKRAYEGKEGGAEEREVFREVVGEHIEALRQSPQGLSSSSPAVTHWLTDDEKKKAEEIHKEKEREEQIRTLIEIALTKNIRNAIKIAESTTPYLLDELHDRLADEYYDKLVQLRKLKMF